MRFGKKINDYRNKTYKNIFAWIPIRIKGETRWLESVKLGGYYYVGALSDKVRFMPRYFID